MQLKEVLSGVLAILIIIGFVQIITYDTTPIPESYGITYYGEKLAYEVVGEGPTNLIVIHGSPGDRSTFDSLAPLLAEKYTVYIFEMPGFGESELQVSNYGYAASAGRLYQALESIGLDSYIIAGYSWGGGVAAHFAANYPDKITELWLLAGVGVPKGFHTGTYHSEQLRMYATAPFLLIYPGSLIPSQFDYAHRHGFWRSFLDGDTRTMYQVMPNIEVPTRIIHGEGDTVVGVAAAYIHHELIPNSTLELFEGGHGVIFSRAEILAEVILRE